MRTTILFSVLTLTSSLSLAKSPEARRTPSSSRRALDLNETGQRREIELQVHTTVAPAPAITTGDGPQPADHGPTAEAPPARANEGQPLSGDALEELIGRQMRRNLRHIDGCLAEASKRGPARQGQLTLDVTLNARKVATMTVAEDKIGDPALGECLQKSAPAWTFSMQQARFSWVVTLGPTRFGAR